MAQVATRLALEGGPKTVTVPPGDRWQTISDARGRRRDGGAPQRRPVRPHGAARAGVRRLRGHEARARPLQRDGRLAQRPVRGRGAGGGRGDRPLLHLARQHHPHPALRGHPRLLRGRPGHLDGRRGGHPAPHHAPHPGRGGDPRAGQPGGDGRHPGRHPAGGHHGDRGRLARPRRHLRRHAGRRAGRHRLLLAAGEQGGHGHRGRGGHHRPQRPLRADGRSWDATAPSPSSWSPTATRTCTTSAWGSSTAPIRWAWPWRGCSCAASRS